MRRIDEMTKAERITLQRDLIRYGYLPAVTEKGRPSDDGVLGPKTIAAYEAYLADLSGHIQTVAPAPAKPWWTSSALIGGLISVAAWGASLAGFEFDVQAAKATIPELVGAVFAVVAVVGTWRRKAPIDPTLVLPGVRVPTRQLRHPHVPPGPAPSSQPNRPDVDQARGHFGDDF